MGNNPTCLATAVRSISECLNTHRTLVSNPPQLHRPKLFGGDLEFPKFDSGRGQAYFLSYLFSILGPSETLRLTMGCRDGRLAEFTPKKDEALIGPRAFKGPIY